jgi:hypothetical protein
MSEALFCGIQADGRTWTHLLTIEQVEDPDRPGPAIVVTECPEHPHTPSA